MQNLGANGVHYGQLENGQLHTFLRGVRGVSETSSQTTILHFSRDRKQTAHLISATCLGDLCAAINSLGKSAVGQSEHTHLSVKLHEKTQK